MHVWCARCCYGNGRPVGTRNLGQVGEGESATCQPEAGSCIRSHNKQSRSSRHGMPAPPPPGRPFAVRARKGRSPSPTTTSHLGTMLEPLVPISRNPLGTNRSIYVMPTVYVRNLGHRPAWVRACRRPGKAPGVGYRRGPVLAGSGREELRGDVEQVTGAGGGSVGRAHVVMLVYQVAVKSDLYGVLLEGRKEGRAAVGEESTDKHEHWHERSEGMLEESFTHPKQAPERPHRVTAMCQRGSRGRRH